jgi:hypothetical protein
MAAAPAKATFSKFASDSSAEIPWGLGVITFIRPSIISINSYARRLIRPEGISASQAKAYVGQFIERLQIDYFFPPLFLIKAIANAFGRGAAAQRLIPSTDHFSPRQVLKPAQGKIPFVVAERRLRVAA